MGRAEILRIQRSVKQQLCMFNTPKFPYFAAMRTALLLSICLLASHSTFAQMNAPANPKSGFDSLGVSRDSSLVQSGTLDQASEYGKPALQRQSYSLDRFQFYLPVYRTQYINSTLGNNGTALQVLQIEPAFNRGFHPGYRTFLPYTFSLDSVRYYDARSPFTQAQYVQGSKQENFFRLIHTQNIGQAFNFGIDYQRINSEGFYTRQKAAHSAIQFHGWLRPENSRYQAFVAAVYHKGVVQENGGLNADGDSLYRNNIEQNRKLLPVSIETARNQVFRNGVQWRQQFDLRRKSTDSTAHHRGFLRIQQTASYQFQRHTYDDPSPDSAFYPAIFNALQNNTAWLHQLWAHEIALLRLSAASDTGKAFQSEFRAFLRQQGYHAAVQDYGKADSLLIKGQNQSAGGSLRLRKGNLKVQGQAEVFLSGYNSGDTRLDARLDLPLGQHMHLVGELQSFLQQPDYQYQNFRSNFQHWQHNFNKTALAQLKARIILKPLRLQAGISNQTLGNWVVADSLGRPEQIAKGLNVLSIFAQHELPFGAFRLQSRIRYQQISDAEILRMPAFQWQESLFWETAFRKSSTRIRIGIDVTGCSAFQAYGYNPWSGLFFRSNTASNKGLLQADAYLSARISRARIFIKVEHFNARFGEPEYILIPGYPLPDLALKLGLNWSFFD